MTIDTKKLREIAEDATPGPWKATGWQDESFDGNHIIENHDKKIVARTDASDLFENNAAFIAAFDPRTVIAMLDEIDHKRAILEAQERRVGPKLGDDPVEVARRWNGNSGESEPDFDMNPEDTASFLAAAVIEAHKKIESARVAARALCAHVSQLGGIVDDNAPGVMALAGPIGDAEAALYVALGIYEEGRAEIEKFGALGRPFDGLTLEQITALFAKHCECRPIDLNRKSDEHAAIHDCDTAILADVQAALFGDGEKRRLARMRCAEIIRGAK